MSRQYEKRRLKYLATINDEALGEDTAPEYELKYIDIGNVDSTGKVSEIAEYRFETAPSRARRIVRSGDVIISTVRTYLEAIAPIENPPENLIVSTGFAVIRPRQDSLSPNYCRYALRERTFINEVVARSTGVSYPAINASDLGDIEIFAPPIEKQEDIARFLDGELQSIEALISAKQNLLTTLAEKRRALITHAVTQGLDPNAPMRDSGIPWLGKIPAHWMVKRARYLFRESNLPVGTGDDIVTCFRNGEVTLRKNRREEGFTNAILELGYQGIRRGQLVLHSMDAFAGAIGISDSDGKCSPEYIVCDAVTEWINLKYYAILLREMALRNFIQASCPAVRERAPRIRFNDLKDFYLPIPELDEQNKIIDQLKELKPIDTLVEKTKTTLAAVQERRTALISAAVTGQLEIPT